jgi:hypothetical protein
MNTQKLLFEIHDADITSAIQALEQKTSGELRVYVTNQPTDDALAPRYGREIESTLWRAWKWSDRSASSTVSTMAPPALRFSPGR